MKKSVKVLKVLFVAIMAFTLTGCVKFNATMETSKNGKINYNILYAIDKKLLNGEKIITDEQSTHSVPILSPNPSPCREAATPPERKGTEATAQSAVDIYREIIKDNIDYHILKQDMKFDSDRLDEIVDLMLETVCTARKRVRIAGDDYPAELVKSKFMKLDGEHIRFVLDCMRENTTKIRNIKQYLKAALFNAPSTIGNYYTSLVAHDMASGALSPKKPQYGDPDYYSCNEGESL